jgi:hypothetical protein
MESRFAAQRGGDAFNIAAAVYARILRAHHRVHDHVGRLEKLSVWRGGRHRSSFAGWGKGTMAALNRQRPE